MSSSGDSNHFDGKRFYNLDRDAKVHKTLFDLLKWKFTRNITPWPKWVENTEKPNLPEKILSNEVYITYINHATLLLQFQNLTLLTDPVFSNRVSPFSWIGPKRVRNPGLSLAELPPIDIVAISHNHYDHLDLSTLITLKQHHNPLFIIPLANAKLLKKNNINNVVELDWWQEYRFSTNQHITLTPAQHWSGRQIIDSFTTLWGGFVFTSNDLNVYFAGDTGYSSHFEMIKSHFMSIDVSILPIGSYEPRWFMRQQHVNPSEAVQAHRDLESKLSIGMHFGTFQLTDEGIDEPIHALHNALQEANILPSSFLTPSNGRTMHYIKD